MGGRPKTAKINDGPGPGAYNQLSKTFAVTSTNDKMSKEARMKLDAKDTPGPGMYQSDQAANFSKTKSQTFGFGTQKRQTKVGNDNDMPGPGNYDINNKS